MLRDDATLRPTISVESRTRSPPFDAETEDELMIASNAADRGPNQLTLAKTDGSRASRLIKAASWVAGRCVFPQPPLDTVDWSGVTFAKLP
jgi:hypothetical protein